MLAFRFGFLIFGAVCFMLSFTSTWTANNYCKALSLNRNFPQPSHAFTTVSGKPVCRYALGGAARSAQPSSLPSAYYYDHLQLANNEDDDVEYPHGAPFYFYYNPHRYPAFMSGVQDLCYQSKTQRENLFVASGGTERSKSSMDRRLQDALQYCGGVYLDMFVIEYVCPPELMLLGNDDDGTAPNLELQSAIQQAQDWKRKGIVRYVGASTHSHRVGAALAADNGIDTVMLRYSMSHEDAAHRISFPACVRHNKPVIVFTTTRWNNLQDGHVDWNDDDDGPPPTTGDCLSFALTKQRQQPHHPVEIVLHSARDEDELEVALRGLREDMPVEEITKWQTYGDLDWNSDGFDEYPEERLGGMVK